MPRLTPPSPRSGFIEPCLPSRADRPPSGPGWIHEIKHDGYRLMARRNPTGISLLTRNGHDWAPRYPLIVEAVDRLKVRSCLMDGEAVACDKNGLAVFERLRHQYELALCRWRRAPRLPFPPARSPRPWCGCGGGLRLHQRQHQPRLRVDAAVGARRRQLQLSRHPRMVEAFVAPKIGFSADSPPRPSQVCPHFGGRGPVRSRAGRDRWMVTGPAPGSACLFSAGLWRRRPAMSPLDSQPTATILQTVSSRRSTTTDEKCHPRPHIVLQLDADGTDSALDAAADCDVLRNDAAVDLCAIADQ